MHLKFRGRPLGFSTSGLVAQCSHQSQWKAGPKNVGLAVGISVIVLLCLEARTHSFEVFWPLSWIFPLPVAQYSYLSQGKAGLKSR